MADTDAHLTDHEWRLKMASEGKAVYRPGKTAEQISTEKAAECEHLAQKSSRTVMMTTGEWGALDTAIPDVIEILNDVGNILHGIAYSNDLDRIDVNSIMRLAARAVESMEEKELHALERLDTAIRHATRQEAP